jgi:hypothetical protein
MIEGDYDFLIDVEIMNGLACKILHDCIIKIWCYESRDSDKLIHCEYIWERHSRKGSKKNIPVSSNEL